MKKILLILFCLPFIGFGQQTYVPDNYFEEWLENMGMGNGVPNDNYVTTANINTVTSLQIFSDSITDLTGIEGFTSLTYLFIQDGGLTSLDVSNNTALTVLTCNMNPLTSLDVSQNLALTSLNVGHNQLTSLDVSNNTALTTLDFQDNQLTSIDVSNNDLVYIK